MLRATDDFLHSVKFVAGRAELTEFKVIAENQKCLLVWRTLKTHNRNLDEVFFASASINTAFCELFAMQSRYTFSPPFFSFQNTRLLTRHFNSLALHKIPTHIQQTTGSETFVLFLREFVVFFSNEINFCNKGNRKHVSKWVRKVKAMHVWF